MSFSYFGVMVFFSSFIYSAIRRCILPPPNGPIYFSDVIFADIGTSFAKVFGGIWLSLWMLKPGNSILVPPVEDNWLRWVFPTIMRYNLFIIIRMVLLTYMCFSIPFFLRFRQCLIEYNLPTNESQKPLFNAFKYATSFPVIFLSAAQRIVVSDLVKERGERVANEPWHGEHPLFRLWYLSNHFQNREYFFTHKYTYVPLNFYRLLAAVVNSLYSFWWDVTNDWGLELLQVEVHGSERQPPRPLVLPRLYSGTPLINRLSLNSSRPENHHVYPTNNNPKHHRQSCVGLRPILLYPRAIYPILIFVNLVLRMTWSIKLSTHVDAMRVGSVGFFWLEVAELVRRWLWVFLRVEWETLKRPPRERIPTSNSSLDDISEYEMIPATPDL